MVAMAPAPRRVLTLLLDNYDSYTFNIFQMLAEVNGVAPLVIKNDDFQGDWHAAWAHFQQHAQCVKSQFESTATASPALELVCNVVISPGPGHPAVPSDFGMCAEAIRACAHSGTPLLGVCLGHQGLALVYGGRVVNAPEVMHGRTSRIVLDKQSDCQGNLLFAHMPNAFEVVRYHSLVVDPLCVPKELLVTARTEDGVIMALQHRNAPQFGVQFHPEAVCSAFGYQIFQNFHDLSLGVSPSACRLQHGDRSPSSLSSDPLVAPQEISRPTDCPKQEAHVPVKYQVLIDRVATGVASLDFAQHVFHELFGGATRSFWLDSSNYVEPAATPAATHSTTGTTRGSAKEKSPQTSRFSFMGDDSGPLSHCLEYGVLQRQLRVTHSHDGTVTTTDDCDAMATLRAQLNEFQSHETGCLMNERSADDAVPFGFRGGYVGYLGYEMLANGLEDENRDTSARVLRDHILQKQQQLEAVPDMSLLFADRVVVFDHHDACVYTLSVSPTGDQVAARAWHSQTATKLLATTTESSRAKSPSASAASVPQHGAVVFHPSRSRDQYIHDIAAVQQQIHDGETYEVCLTNQLRAQVSIHDPLAFYEQLRRRNPAPYAAFYLSNPENHFQHHRWSNRSSSSRKSSSCTGESMQQSYAVCCSSPERFLRVDAGGWMESKPIKGTRRRGRTPSEDDAIKHELAHCHKDRAENMMIADLVRNDFGRVAQIGSVYVPALMRVESYATVHQLVTTVRARQSPHADLVDVVCATFPGGSMTGAPKKRTMQLIRSLERHPRGVYSGALGFFSLDGSCDLNIIIRTALVTKTSVSLGSGGAIIALSECDDEYDEMLLKTSALVQAVGAFVTGREDGSGAHVASTTISDTTDIPVVQ